MKISIAEAEGQLGEVVRRAEAGEEVVLTRDDQPVVQLVPVRPTLDRAARRKLLDDISREAAAKITPGPDAAHSQDFLYDENGLPK